MKPTKKPFKNPDIALLEKVHYKLRNTDIDNFHKNKSSEYDAFTRRKFAKYSWDDLLSIADSINNLKFKSRIEILKLIENIENLFNYPLRFLEYQNEDQFLYNLYEIWDTEIKVPDEAWHEFCRLSHSYEMFSKMEESIITCISNNKLLFNQTFDFKFEKTSARLPDRKARIKQLEYHFNKFQPIYKKIINEISFENRYETQHTSFPKGIILWQKTFLNSINNSSQLVCLVPDRKFDTSENIFLALCLMQILQKVRFLQYQNVGMRFETYEISTLSKISNGSQKMLKFFPFQDALKKARESRSQIGLDDSITQYYKEISDRIEKNLVVNRNYRYLTNWYEEFKTEIKLIYKLKDNDGNFLHESSRSIDTVFEYFIFFNLMDYLDKLEECRVYNIVWNEIDENTSHHSFNFEYKNKSYQFIHSYQIAKIDTKMKLRKLTPDFFIKNLTDDKGIFVADAKNTDNLSDGGKNYNHLIENYMNQTNVKTGLIISRDKEHNRRDNKETNYDWQYLDLDPMNFPEFEKHLADISKLIFKACDKK